MSVEWFNFEHYPDPTAQAALVAMDRQELEKTPRVYICSPLSGDVKRNMERACRYARFAFAQGKHPLAPHLYYPQFMDDRRCAAGAGLRLCIAVAGPMHRGLGFRRENVGWHDTRVGSGGSQRNSREIF